MKESFLHFIWGNGLFGDGNFRTHSGKQIKVLNPGSLNRDSGPDFFNAQILIDGIILVGNIEIHIRSSDWYKHGHHLDAAYNNTILSVVKENDGVVRTQQGFEVEGVTLEQADNLYEEYLFLCNTRTQPACAKNLETLNDSYFYLTLYSIAVERLKRKVDDVKKILHETGGDWGECLYRMICKYWNGHINTYPFYRLALYLPYKTILKYVGNPMQIEALLFGVSGLMQYAEDDEYVKSLKKEYLFLRNKHRLTEMRNEEWKFMRIRPDAFPTVRIALLASFINKLGNFISYLPEIKDFKEFRFIFECEVSDYWKTHYLFGKTSKSRIKRPGMTLQTTLVINAFIPFIFLYGKERNDEEMTARALRWLEEEKAEDNFIVRKWTECGFTFDNAMQTQALIQLFREYCEKKKCLNCRLGREMFKVMSEV